MEITNEQNDRLDEHTELVTVARFMDPTEAKLARGALESAGFAVTMQGENASSLYPGTLSSRLLVSAEDAEAVKEFLAGSGLDVAGPEGDDAL